MDRVLPYSSTSRPPERNKWLTYALNLKPRQRSQSVDPITARYKDKKDFEDATQTIPSQNRAQFYDNLYKKYPKAFQRRTSDASVTSSRTSLPVRSSRRLFNSGLHVHFDDVDRDGSVYSEVPPSLNEWITRENDRNCLTSPTPSMRSDNSVKQRLHDTSDKLRFLLNHKSSPHRRKNERRHRNGVYKMETEYGYPDRYSENVDQIKLLEEELEWKERQLQKFRRKLQYDTSDSSNSVNTRHYSNLNFNSESPPDSAIDLDTLSLQSHVSMDTVNVLANEINIDDNTSFPSLDDSRNRGDISTCLPLSHLDILDEDALELQMSLYTDKAPEHANMKQSYKDSDVDSGIAQSAREYVASDMEADNSQLDISVHNRSLDEENIIMPEPNSKPKQNILKKNASKKPTQPKPLKADHSLQIFVPPSEETEDDESIKEELLNAQLSRHFQKIPQFPVYGNDSGLDDIDDSDPRLGIPEVKGNEQEVAARYHSRRSPSPYTLGKSKFVIKSRPQSAPLFGKENQLRYVNISPRNLDSGNEIKVTDICTNLTNQACSHFKDGAYDKFEGLPVHEQMSEKETSAPNKTSRTPSLSSNSTLSDTSYSSLILSLEQNLLPQRNSVASGKENFSTFVPTDQRDLTPTNQCVQFEDRIPTPKNVGMVESERECFNSNFDVNINTVVGDDTKFNSCDNLVKDDTNYMTDVPCVKLSPFEYAGVGGHRQTVKKQEQNMKLTPYEAAISLDEGGLSVEEIIESDSDNIYSAKKVFLHKPSKQQVLPNSQRNLPDTQGNLRNTQENSLIMQGNLENPQGNLTNTQENSSLSDSSENLPCSVNVKEIDDISDTNISDESENLSDSEEQDGLSSADFTNENVSISGLKLQNEASDSEAVVTDNSQPSEQNNDNAENNTRELYHTNKQVKKELSETTETNHVTDHVTGPVTGHETVPVIGHVKSDKTDHVNINATGHVSRDVTGHVIVPVTGHVTAPGTGHVINDMTGHVIVPVTGHVTAPGTGHVISDCTNNAGNHVTNEIPDTCVAEKGNTASGSKLNSGKSDQRNPHINVEISGNTYKANGTKVAATKHLNDIDDNIVTLDTKDGSEQIPESNLTKTKGLSASRQSLSDKMGNIKKSAKGKFKAIRKAVSMDRGLNKPSLEMEQSAISPPAKQSKGKMPKMKKALSLKNLFSKKKSKHGSVEFLDQISPYSAADNDPTMQHTNMPNHPIARISEICSDGTQIITLKKRQETKPLGIYIARGNQQFKHGIFISRFSDQKNIFAGVINIGDEILELNGISVKSLTLDEVYDIMGNKPDLTMRILPLLARRDI